MVINKSWGYQSKFKKVRKDNLNIPIVVTSAYSNKEYLLSCLNLIIQGYLLKPLSSLIINNVLDKIIKLLKLNESFYIQKDFIYDKTNSIFINSKSNEKIKNIPRQGYMFVSI